MFIVDEACNGGFTTEEFSEKYPTAYTVTKAVCESGLYISKLTTVEDQPAGSSSWDEDAENTEVRSLSSTKQTSADLVCFADCVRIFYDDGFGFNCIMVDSVSRILPGPQTTQCGR
jgi:hypothetical protein